MSYIPTLSLSWDTEVSAKGEAAMREALGNLTVVTTEEVFAARLVAATLDKALDEKEQEVSERIRVAASAASALITAADADNADINASANAAAIAAVNKTIEIVQGQQKKIQKKLEKLERQQKILQLGKASAALKKSQDRLAELMNPESGDSDSSDSQFKEDCKKADASRTATKQFETRVAEMWSARDQNMKDRQERQDENAILATQQRDAILKWQDDLHASFGGIKDGQVRPMTILVRK